MDAYLRIKDVYIIKTNNHVLPVLKVDAPSGYGLDNRFIML